MSFKPKGVRHYKERDLQAGPSGRLVFPPMQLGDTLELDGYFYGMIIQAEEGGSVTSALFTPPKRSTTFKTGAVTIGGHTMPVNLATVEYDDNVSKPVALELPLEGLIDQLAAYLSAAATAALEGKPALDKLVITKGHGSNWAIAPKRP